MAKPTKPQQAERERCINELRDLLKVNDTVYTVLDHVSRSGMTRHIRVVLIGEDDGQPYTLHPNYLVSQALGYRQAKRSDGLVVSGCGMDMGFHVVYSLSRTVFPVYDCTGEKSGPNSCPSNEHVNPGPGRHNYNIGHAHSDGYALHHRWL